MTFICVATISIFSVLKLTNSAWPDSGLSLVGLQGPAGPQGATGPTGPQGIQGVQGLQGTAGQIMVAGSAILSGTVNPGASVGVDLGASEN